MAIFDFLKKKAKPAEVEPKKIKEKKVKEEKIKEKKAEEPRKEIKKEVKKEVKKAKKTVSLSAWRVLKEPHISEKATDLTKENKYIFRIFSNSNKIEIKKAVENLYGVDVLNVRIIKLPRKQKRRGRVTGWKRGYKKAIVKIKEGQKIELLPR